MCVCVCTCAVSVILLPSLYHCFHPHTPSHACTLTHTSTHTRTHKHSRARTHTHTAHDGVGSTPTMSRPKMQSRRATQPKTRSSRGSTRERLYIREQMDNIIGGERTTKGRVREFLFEFASCEGGCICMSTPQRFNGDTATSLKWGEQYYCHHRSKDYHLAKSNLAVASRLASNQTFARPRTVWKIRWEDGDSTDTYERPISKFIVVNARSTDLVAYNALAF